MGEARYLCPIDLPKDCICAFVLILHCFLCSPVQIPFVAYAFFCLNPNAAMLHTIFFCCIGLWMSQDPIVQCSTNASFLSCGDFLGTYLRAVM